MADNAADVSRNSFDFAKFYDSVRLQDGVPIMDSDWNEFEDIRRMYNMLNLIYGFGKNMQFLYSGNAGFEPYGADLDNDFSLYGGSAIVEGALILSSAADPPAGFNYDSVYNNYSTCGIVTEVSSTRITDIYKKWISLGSFGDALKPSVYQGGARVVMTSGVENGNTFTISDVPNSTQLTLSGGTGSIAPGDTYNVLPPALTTPVGSRTDEIFLMVWWEDIAGDEDDDTPLIHPLIGIESCHRYKRKWVVRVTEGGTTPSNSAGVCHSFGYRYLKIGEIARTATATISAGMVTPETSLHVPNYSEHTIDGGGHGISGEYTASAVSAINNGGIGTGFTTFEEIFDAIDEALIKRRAFTAVITDGTSSTGGDFDGANAIDEVSGTLAEGTFFVRRGDYEWSITGMGASDISGTILGESRNSVGISIPSGASEDFPLTGSFKNVSLESDSTTYRYTIFDTNNEVILDNCLIEAGCFYWDQGKLSIRDSVFGTTGASNSSYGFYINQSTINNWEYHEGTFDNVIFSGVCSAAPTKYDTVAINKLSTNMYYAGMRPIPFNGCEFIKDNDNRNALRITSCTDVPIVFTSCNFASYDTGSTSTPLVYLQDSTKIIFRDCKFYNNGPLLDSRATGVVFDNCIFVENTSTSYTAQIFSCEGGYDVANPAVFRDCRIVLNGGGFSATGSMPAIEFGGRGGSYACDSILVDGLTVTFDSGTRIHRYTPVTMWGSYASGGSASYKNITIDCNGTYTDIDRTGYGNLTVAAILEILGLVDNTSICAENINIVNLSNSSTADSSTILAASNVHISGGSIDGTGTNSGTMGSTSYGIVYLSSGCYLKNLYLFPSNEILVETGASIVVVGHHSCISDSYFSTAITNDIVGVIYLQDAYAKCIGNTFNLYFGGDQTYCVITTTSGTDAIHLLVSNNIIRRGTNTSLNKAYINIFLADGSQVVNNIIRCTGLPTSGNIAIYCNGDGCLVDGNTVITEESDTPVITNSGTGSVTGSNVLVASYTP